MAAILPASGIADRPRAAPPPSPGAVQPSALPLRFLVTGVVSLLAGVGVMCVRPDLLATYHYNQYILATTHLFVLGFALSVVMGALYQLGPVSLETPLWSDRLAYWHFPMHVVGMVGMVVSFWLWNLTQVGHFGSLLAAGGGLFIYNLGRTARASARRDAARLGIVSTLAWLSVTLLAGLYLAASKCWEFSPFHPIAAMHAHAHAGSVGVFLLLIVSVSYQLVPMFTLSRVQSERRARASIHLLNLGLAGLFVTMLVGSDWKLAGAGLLLAGLGLYALEMRAILRARLRRRLDWSLRHFLAGLLWLGPVGVLAVVLCWPGLPANALTTQLENVYGLLGLGGVVTLAILGMLYKIAPFLVWLRSYGPRVGQEPVPSLADFHSVRLQAVGFWLYLTGMGITAWATALGHAGGVRIGCLTLAAALVTAAFNLGCILRHWYWPVRLAPAAPTAPPRPDPSPPRLLRSA